jgi:hypothetical protein
MMLAGYGRKTPPKGQRSTRSDVFRRLWGAHDVRTHGAGTKRFCHPVVGELVLAYEELAVTTDPGLALLIYTAEPGSPSAERLNLLASWAASTGLPHTGPARCGVDLTSPCPSTYPANNGSGCPASTRLNRASPSWMWPG